jgi:hypothetical protein
MSIPTAFVAPNLPLATAEYDRSLEERFRNAERIYFALLDNQNRVINEQVSSNQTMIWLNTWD